MIQILGQDAAVRALERGLSLGRLAHAYTLVGPPGVGKMTFALALAQGANCLEEEKPCGHCSQCTRIAGGIHADVMVIGIPEQDRTSGEGPRTEIAIEQVREVQRLSALKPYEGAYRVFIFDEAKRLSPEASNSLLKTLEEPPEDVILVLLASNEELLLPTIISRCQLLEFRRLPTHLVAQELERRGLEEEGKAWELAALSEGSLGWALEALTDPAILEERQQKLERVVSVLEGGIEERFAYAAQLASAFSRDREVGRSELRLWLSLCRDLLLLKEGTAEFLVNIAIKETLEKIAQGLISENIAAILKALEEAIEHLDQNANPRLALEVLMLSLPPMHILGSRKGV